jgi:hypothetical protein
VDGETAYEIAMDFVQRELALTPARTNRRPIVITGG